MRFLLDQDAYALTAAFLLSLGHDVTTAAEAGLSTASDTEVLGAPHAQGRLIVTRDRHFGSLVFTKNLVGGVLYLRVSPSEVVEVHAELFRVLKEHTEDDLRRAFVVVERGRHRFRRIGP